MNFKWDWLRGNNKGLERRSRMSIIGGHWRTSVNLQVFKLIQKSKQSFAFYDADHIKTELARLSIFEQMKRRGRGRVFRMNVFNFFKKTVSLWSIFLSDGKFLDKIFQRGVSASFQEKSYRLNPSKDSIAVVEVLNFKEQTPPMKPIKSFNHYWVKAVHIVFGNLWHSFQLLMKRCECSFHQQTVQLIPDVKSGAPAVLHCVIRNAIKHLPWYPT